MNNDAGIVPLENRRAASSHEVRTEALNFLRGHKFRKAAPEFIPLRTPDATRSTLLLLPKYHREPDTVKLVTEARAYVRDRIPIVSRECAISVLLSRDEHTAFLKKYNLQPITPDPLECEDEHADQWSVEIEPPMRRAPPISEGRKFR